MPNTLVHPDSTKQTRTGNYSLNLTGSSQNFLKLENLMNRDVVTITPEQSVFSASKKMSKKNVSCIVVLNGTDVTGILTEKDIVNLLARGEKSYGKIKVAQIMSSPVELPISLLLMLLHLWKIRILNVCPSLKTIN